MPGNTIQSGTNAASNAYDDAGHTARRYVPRIPSFHWHPGPWHASVKRPVTGWQHHTWPASGRRPIGAGWARGDGWPGREQHPGPSPAPWGQGWRSSFAPRAYQMRTPRRGNR